MWNHRNEVIFQDSNPNPSQSLLKLTIYSLILCFTTIKQNFFPPTRSTNAVTSTKSRNRISTHWNPPPLNRLKWNTHASNIPPKKLTFTEIVCRDSNGYIILSKGNKIRDVSVLVRKAIAIREVLRAAKKEIWTILWLVESDSQIVINSIKGQTDVRSLIVNRVINIRNLAMNFNNVKFSYCTRTQSSLANSIAKRAYNYCNPFLY